MTSYGELLNFILRNSGRTIGVFRWKYFKSNLNNFEPRVDIILFISILIVKRLAVGIPQSMSIFKLLPPNVNLVRLVSSFCKGSLQTILL